jgi:hypothetical protein
MHSQRAFSLEHRVGHTRTLALAALLSLGGPLTAHALDANEMANRYKALAEANGAQVEFQSVEQKGEDGFEIRGISFKSGGMRQTLKLEFLSAQGVQEGNGNSLKADSIAIGPISMEGPGDDGKVMALRIDGGEGQGIYYADPADENAPLIGYPQSSVRLGEISFAVEGKTVLRSDGLQVTAVQDAAGTTLETFFAMSPMEIDLSLVEDPTAKARLAQLGIEAVKLGVSLSALWDMNSGRMEISNYSFDFTDIGRLNLDIVIDGYTQELAKKLRGMGARAQAAEKQNAEAQQAAGAEMMTALGDLKLVSAGLEFRDASITGKVMEMQAAAMGSSKEELAMMLPMMAVGMTQALQNPAFSEMVAAALGAFFANPGTIRIEAKPAEPVPFTDLVGAGLAHPQGLITILDVKVRANQ